ncbi:MAG TPA: sigma-70 family RNA polymerase sigma factor [Sedimentisphaerales bacterium]|nr:sigma-70 family RNA polymerase sigma factor [Sedimentisphaerales bacterium]
MTQETQVIHQVLQGDIESFRLIVERYERPIVRMIRNIINNKDSCEDIAQDVFFTAYRKLASFDPARSNFSTWLFTIARNKSINALRKKRPVSMSELPQNSDIHNPSDELAERDLFDKLDAGLEALPSAQKRAFVLAEFEELSYEDIAQIEGVRTGTIKSRINRAKKKLAKALKEIWYEK